MDKKLIKKMKDSKRVHLNKSELFWHYSIVYFILLIPLIDVFFVIKNNQPWLEFKYTYLLVLVAIFMFFLQRNRLKFKKLKINDLSDNFNTAIEITAQELNWVIDYNSNNFIRAHRGFNYKSGGSWGEMITIIKLGDAVLINSICDPNGLFTSLLSYGWNRRNVSRFEKNLNKIISIPH